MTSQQILSLSDRTSAPPAPFSLDGSLVLERNKATLLEALAQRGVSSARVTYAGAGNAGRVGSMTFEIAEGPALDETAVIKVLAQRNQFRLGKVRPTIVEEAITIERALRDFAEAALEGGHGCGTQAEGTSGSVVFDCFNGIVCIEQTVHWPDSDSMQTT